MKVSQSSGSNPPANRAPQASKPEVLAYETAQDQMTLYGEDGQPMAGSARLKSGGDSFFKNL